MNKSHKRLGIFKEYVQPSWSLERMWRTLTNIETNFETYSIGKNTVWVFSFVFSPAISSPGDCFQWIGFISLEGGILWNTKREKDKYDFFFFNWNETDITAERQRKKEKIILLSWSFDTFRKLFDGFVTIIIIIIIKYLLCGWHIFSHSLNVYSKWGRYFKPHLCVRKPKSGEVHAPSPRSHPL